VIEEPVSWFGKEDTMKLSTQDQIEEYEITETLGLVWGNTIRSRDIGNSIVAGLRTIVGGEIKEYTQMMTEAREEALQRMIHEADKLQADGVVGLRMTTAEVMAGTAELLAYGTAVKLRKRAKS
jgi:uncharacterized protein YbjQ (UPF0145 family)